MTVEHCVPLAGFDCPYMAFMCWTGTLIWFTQTSKQTSVDTMNDHTVHLWQFAPSESMRMRITETTWNSYRKEIFDTFSICKCFLIYAIKTAPLSVCRSTIKITHHVNFNVIIYLLHSLARTCCLVVLGFQNLARRVLRNLNSKLNLWAYNISCKHTMPRS